MIDNNDKIRLLSGKPIQFENSFIKQATLSEIIDVGVEEYYNKCFPFLISLDYLGVNIPENKDFDLFWVLAGEKILNKNLLELLVEGLVFFFKTENIKFDQKNREIILDDRTILNRDNYDNLAEKIMAISKTERLKKQSKKENKISDRAKKYLAQREKFKKESGKEEEGLTKVIYDMINYLSHYSDSPKYDDILNLTMYQANNSIKIYNKKDTFNINLNAHFAGAKVNKKDLEHWAS